MKSLLVLLSLCFLSGVSFGQTENWELYRTIDGVEIYTTQSDCYPKNIPDQKGIIIKVVNTTGDDVTIEWDKALWYNDELATDASDNENHYSITVGKNSSQEGSCDVPRGALYIYKDFITYKTDTKLTKFELQNIKVTRL